jgi:hypothetical protein
MTDGQSEILTDAALEAADELAAERERRVAAVDVAINRGAPTRTPPIGDPPTEAVVAWVDKITAARRAADNCPIHDSGTRQQFDTGAVRDTAEDKPRPDLFSPFAEERIGEWLRLGAQKYSDRNWEKGIPNSRCFASLRRHAMKYYQGDTTEDHLAAICFNAAAIMHNEEMIARGVLPGELDDMPKYEEKGGHS